MAKSAQQHAKQRSKNSFLAWIASHKLDTLFLSVLLVLSGIIGAINMTGYPQRFEDEGTYISQAWAIKERGTLTHYTYWYDHPPVGWIQMAGHLMLTDALDRYGSAITAGREFMLLLHLATIGLLYALARRLGMGSVATLVGGLFYALSPLTIEFSRYVLLDNVALPWLLGALLLALSPKKHILTALGSAICMAIAVLSKETFIVLLPVLLYALWSTGDKRNRRFCLAAFSVVFIAICAFYVLYASLKNELFPGEGHVSLLGTFFWQLLGREGSGSILDASSDSRDLAKYWLRIDAWLILSGVFSLSIAFFYRRLRVAAFCLLIGLLVMMRSGYLPFPYIIMLLPFAALVFAGVVHYALIRPLKEHRFSPRGVAIRTFIIALVSVGTIFMMPAWNSKLTNALTQDYDLSSRQTVSWVAQNVDRNNRLVVESALWTDIQRLGFTDPNPVWLYKTETDPAVVEEIGGWQGIDYVVLNGPTTGAANFEASFPTTHQAIQNAEVVAEFGQDNQKIVVYKVRN